MERSLIESQPEGSDIHGLVKHIAYFIYLKGVQNMQNREINSSTSNWARAIDYVLNASLESDYSNNLRSPELYRHTLEIEVQEIHKKEECDEKTAWNKAQYKLAKLIFDCIERKK